MKDLPDLTFKYKIIGRPKRFNSLKDKVAKFTNEEWCAWGDRRVFKDQKESLTIPLYNQPDRDSRVFNKKIINKHYINLLDEELRECFSMINQLWGGGEPKRVMLVNLPAGKNVEQHVDMSRHLTRCRRIHLPIVTNNQVKFFCRGDIIPMDEGVLTDFNNKVMHSVLNESTKDRIHLIIDWGQQDDPFYNDESYMG